MSESLETLVPERGLQSASPFEHRSGINSALQASRRFSFARNTFPFANELIWQYHFDPVTGAMRTCRNHPPPTYTHRCFVMVRSARQFFFHARFEPGLAPVEEPAYRRLIREVVSRSPRQPSSESEKIVIPGYDCLRSFSRAKDPLLK